MKMKKVAKLYLNSCCLISEHHLHVGHTDGSISTTIINKNMYDKFFVLVAVAGQNMIIIRDGSIGTTGQQEHAGHRFGFY